jgi:ABC-type nitrate/sulfonate/bicarbonate transport system substrate-binding protein
MTRRQAPLIVGIFLAACLISSPTHAAQPKKLRLAFSAFAYANPPFWIAHELKLFEKYGGYETDLIYVGGSRPIQAMLGGSVDVSQVGGAAAVGAAANGAEIAILGTVFTRLSSLFTPVRKSSRSPISRARRSRRERRAATATSPHWRF